MFEFNFIDLSYVRTYIVLIFKQLTVAAGMLKLPKLFVFPKLYRSYVILKSCEHWEIFKVIKYNKSTVD